VRRYIELHESTLERNLAQLTKIERMEAALQSVADLVAESEGVAGYHKNSTVAEWEGFDFMNEISTLLPPAEATATPPQEAPLEIRTLPLCRDAEIWEQIVSGEAP
jgi:hypothetical protein